MDFSEIIRKIWTGNLSNAVLVQKKIICIFDTDITQMILLPSITHISYSIMNDTQ